MSETVISESVSVDEIRQQFERKAKELKLKTPVLPFLSICMDGEPYKELNTTRPFPLAHEAPEERLRDMGKMWTDGHGVLEFVDERGRYHLARAVEANMEALKAAGFEQGYRSAMFVSNGAEPVGPNKDLFRRILHTPKDEQERLFFAVCDGDLGEFNHAVAHGAGIRGAKTWDGSPLVFYAVSIAPSPERDEIVRKMLPESGLRSEQGETLLHHTLKSHYSTITILPDIMNAGLTPLDRNSYGTPAFLAVDCMKDDAGAEWRLLKDTMLKTPGLTGKEKKLLEAQFRLIEGRFDETPGRDLANLYTERLSNAWSAAQPFALPDEKPPAIPEFVQSFLEPLTDPKRAPAFLKVLETFDYNQASRLTGINDLVREFTSHVVLPQVLMDYSRQLGVPLTDENLRAVNDAHPGLLDRLVPVVKAELFRGRSLDKVIGLNEAWHDPQVMFPDALKPIRAAGEWHSLTEKREHAIPELPGITIHVLTTDKELESEGKTMRHCVGGGGYATKCFEGKSHIFSVRQEGQEKPLSTFEASWDGKEFKIVQNRGPANDTPVNEARIAAEWFKHQIETRKIPTGRAGETEESRKQNGRPGILRTIGYEITQENIDAAYGEYAGNDKRHARELNPATGKFDITSRNTRLIASSLNIDLRSDSFLWLDSKTGKPKRTSVSPKLLSANVWFEASGMRDKAMAATLQPAIDAELERRRAAEAQRSAENARKKKATGLAQVTKWFGEFMRGEHPPSFLMFGKGRKLPASRQTGRYAALGNADGSPLPPETIRERPATAPNRSPN